MTRMAASLPPACALLPDGAPPVAAAPRGNSGTSAPKNSSTTGWPDPAPRERIGHVLAADRPDVRGA